VLHEIISRVRFEDTPWLSTRNNEVLQVRRLVISLSSTHLFNLSCLRRTRLNRDCIKRHCHAREVPGKRLVFVSKNPTFTMRIATLYGYTTFLFFVSSLILCVLDSSIDVFPTGKVICMIRDPVQSVPSMVSYISHIWHTFSTPKIKYPNAKVSFFVYDCCVCIDKMLMF
jgi:hypothetical protein